MHKKKRKTIQLTNTATPDSLKKPSQLSLQHRAKQLDLRKSEIYADQRSGGTTTQKKEDEEK